MTKRCPECNVLKQSNFCPDCGTVTIPNLKCSCGKDDHWTGDKFCSDCGKELLWDTIKTK